MNSKASYLIKNIGILTVSNFASKILVFLLVPLYTSILSTTEYGTYDLVISTVQLIVPLLTLNIIDAVMRYSMDKEYNPVDIVNVGLKYVLRCCILSFIFLYVCNRIALVPSIEGYEILIGMYIVSYSANQFLIQLSKGQERVLDMGIAGIVGTAFLIGGNIVFLLMLRIGLKGFFIANILSQAVPSIYLCTRIKIWKFIRFRNFNEKLRREMLSYCLPLIFSTLGWWINNASDKYVVAFICGTSANGLLSVAYKIPSIINVFQGIFIQAWQISAIKEYKSEDANEFYGKAFVCVNLVMSICCAGLILLAKPIGQILYANEFYLAWKYVPFLLMSSVINAASGFLGPILSAVRDSKNMAKSAIYGSIVNIILNIGLVYYMGIQGATIATLIASLIIYIVRMRAVGNKIHIISYWKVCLTWAILCFQATIEITTTNYLIQMILIILLLVINMKTFSEIILMLINLTINNKDKGE